MRRDSSVGWTTNNVDTTKVVYEKEVSDRIFPHRAFKFYGEAAKMMHGECKKRDIEDTGHIPQKGVQLQCECFGYITNYEGKRLRGHKKNIKCKISTWEHTTQSEEQRGRAADVG